MSTRRVVVLRDGAEPHFVTRAKAARMVANGAARWVGAAQGKVRLIDKIKERAVSDPCAGTQQDVWRELAALYPLRGVHGGSIRPRVSFGRCRRVSQ